MDPILTPIVVAKILGSFLTGLGIGKGINKVTGRSGDGSARDRGDGGRRIATGLFSASTDYPFDNYGSSSQRCAKCGKVFVSLTTCILCGECSSLVSDLF